MIIIRRSADRLQIRNRRGPSDAEGTKVGQRRRQRAADYQERLANITKHTKGKRWCPGQPVPEHRWNMFHRDVFTSPHFLALHRTAKLLLLHLFAQWNGFNNGELQATVTWLKRCGWGDSDRSVADALSELTDAGFIKQKRHPTRSRAAWYSLTWVVNKDDKDSRWEIEPV